MKKNLITKTLNLATVIALLSACASIPKKAEPVKNFDVNRYLGIWYEVARFDS